MENNGIRPEQVVQVRGYANHNLRKPLEPNDASNRRVTVIIQYVSRPDPMPVIVSSGSISVAKVQDAGSASVGQKQADTEKKAKGGM
jgi:chemotaxis protein MotB